MEPYEGTEPYIFMSYARKDWERVKPFLDALSNAGYHFWYDAGISAGERWKKTLLKKINECEIFCPLFSEAFNASLYCFWETAWAYQNDKKIVPLYLKPIEKDSLDQLYRLLREVQDLCLYQFANAAQFAARLKYERIFAPCKAPEWNKIGQIQWRLDADGLLTIAKNDLWDLDYGRIPDYQEDPSYEGNSIAPWMLYREKILSVVIEDDIEVIGEFAFSNLEHLTKALIGNGVTEIGGLAFWGCQNLRDIRIPDSVTVIGDGAFLACDNLTNVRVGDHVTAIRDRAFFGCFYLTDVWIGDRVKEIGDDAFGNCESLKNVRMSDSVKEIGGLAFDGCKSLQSVKIPAGAKVADNSFPKHTRVIRRDAAQ